MNRIAEQCRLQRKAPRDEPCWDSIVLSMGRVANFELYEQVKGLAPVVRQIGDCLAPRTLEEATYEGFLAGLEI